MTDQQPTPMNPIADQRAFFSQLGINPDTVAPNTLTINFDREGFAVVSFTTVHRVAPQAIGVAFLAGAGALGGGAADQTQEIAPPAPHDEDTNVTPLSRPVKRAAAKKAAAKKAPVKKP